MEMRNIIERQQSYFKTQVTKSIDYRVQMLKKLKIKILSMEEEITEALSKDLGKSAFESYAAEIGFILKEIGETVKNLKNWMKPQRVKTNIINKPGKSKIYAEPFGLVLVIAPWNYPFQLAISPMIGAIAAGNCVTLKPSELSTHTALVLDKLIKTIFSPEYISCILGGIAETTALLSEKWDYIFFTGSTAVGKIVMQAAAKNPTPVTLELGGKSPCIIDKTADLKVAARRIAWGKWMNAGQTCIAPDYLYVHETVKDEFVKILIETVREFYTDNPRESKDYGRIISERHFERLLGLMKHGQILFGGEMDQVEKYLSPTIIGNVNRQQPIMQEEIFGPLLPILEFNDIRSVIDDINKFDKPLALYFFSKEKKTWELILQNVSFGGGCFNDTISHIINPHLPFGGVGSSGMGSYHGKKSFDTFSHFKSVYEKPTFFDMKLRYPPYGDKKLKWLKDFLK